MSSSRSANNVIFIFQLFKTVFWDYLADVMNAVQSLLKSHGQHHYTKSVFLEWPFSWKNWKIGHGKKEKSGKMSSCMWSVTASIVLDTKNVRKELFTRCLHIEIEYSCHS